MPCRLLVEDSHQWLYRAAKQQSYRNGVLCCNCGMVVLGVTNWLLIVFEAQSASVNP